MQQAASAANLCAYLYIFVKMIEALTYGHYPTCLFLLALLVLLPSYETPPTTWISH